MRLEIKVRSYINGKRCTAINLSSNLAIFTFTDTKETPKYKLAIKCVFFFEIIV